VGRSCPSSTRTTPRRPTRSRRRQRLPGAQVAILLQAEELLLLTDRTGSSRRNPRHAADAELIAEVSESRRSTRWRSECRAHRSGPGALRSRWWLRRWPRPPGSRRESPTACDPSGCRGVRGRGCRHALPAAAGTGLQLQAVAEVRESHPRPARGRRGCRYGVARARDIAAAGGITRVEGEFEPGDAVEVTANGRPSARGSSTTRPWSCGGDRVEDGRVRELLRGRATRPCTVTTSFSNSRGEPAPAPGTASPMAFRRVQWPRSAPPRRRRHARSGGSTPRRVDAALEAIAAALDTRVDEILEANALDVQAGGRPRSARRCSTGCG